MNEKALFKLEFDKIIAAGILNPVNIMLINDGAKVLPNPKYAPAVVISIHINI